MPGGSRTGAQVPAGKRTSGDDTTTERLAVECRALLPDGTTGPAVGIAKNKSEASVNGGYVNDT